MGWTNDAPDRAIPTLAVRHRATATPRRARAVCEAVMRVDAWTAVARRASDEPYWRELDAAPMTLTVARQLLDKGYLLMAQRRVLNCMELVVKSPTRRKN